MSSVSATSNPSTTLPNSNIGTPFGATYSSTTRDLQNLEPSYRLDGRNYLQWSQVVRTFLKGKGKLSRPNGTGPQQDDPRFVGWDEEGKGRCWPPGAIRFCGDSL